MPKFYLYPELFIEYSNFPYVQVETKLRIWCNTILKHCCR